MKKVAFIFAGQGSQKIGMGKEFFDNFDFAQDMIKKASERIGVNFEELLFQENNKLEETEFTQPAILLVGIIAFEIFKQKCNIKPEFVLGHSLGEFSALVISGALDPIDAIELVHKRGLFMKEACQNLDVGMMALIGLEDKKAEEITEKARLDGKKVWCANYNSDGQIVLAGLKDDLSELENSFKDGGAKKTVLLNMSVASHCPLLQSAREKLDIELDRLLKDNFLTPVVSNVTAEKYLSKKDAIKLLSQQLVSPVLYKQSIQKFENEVDLFIEFGNGVVLKGLNRRVIKTKTESANSIQNIEKVIDILNS